MRSAWLAKRGLRLRVGFQLFLALLATAIGIGLVVMVRDAVTSRSVVIESFDTPPALAASGVSGRVVAAGLLDVLTGIQAASRTGAERRSLSNAWTSEIAIEVPETGVSIGQIERMLKSRFGHDLHIDGDLVQTEKGGLALTVRGSGILPKTFTDEARNLDKLLTEAGEYVYGQSQPGLWAAYLSNNDRNDEAIPGVALAKHGDRSRRVLPFPPGRGRRIIGSIGINNIAMCQPFEPIHAVGLGHYVRGGTVPIQPPE